MQNLIRQIPFFFTEKIVEPFSLDKGNELNKRNFFEQIDIKSTHTLFPEYLRHPNSVFIDLSVAFLAVSLILLIDFQLQRFPSLFLVPYFLGIFPVIFSSWYGGLRAGIFATLLSVAATTYFFILTSQASLIVSATQIATAAILILEGLITSFLIDNLHIWLHKTDNYARQVSEIINKYKRVLERINDILLITDIEGNVLYATPSIEKNLGYKPKETIGQNLYSLIKFNDAKYFQSEVVKAIDKKNSFSSIFFMKHKNRGWVAIDASTSFLNGDNPNLLVITARNITEEKAADDKAKEHLNLLHTVIESTSDVVSVKNLQGKYILINSAVAKDIGKRPTEIIGKDDSSFYPSEIVKQFQKSEEKVIHSGSTITSEERITNNGKGKICISTRSPFRDKQNNIIGVVAICHNITEWKQNEEKLEELNKRITNILESITDAFFALDNDGRFVYLNKQAERLLEVAGQKVIGKSVWDEFPEIIDSEFYKKYFRAIATQKPITFEKFYSPLKKYFDVHAYPSSEGLSVYFNDITKRKETEDVLRINEERFRLLAESVPQIIWTAEIDGYRDYHNQRWYEYTGLSYEQTCQWGWKKSVHQEDMAEIESEWQRSLKTGKVYEVECRIKKGKDKQFRWYLVRALPIKNKEKRIIKWFGTCTDIDEQKKLDKRKDEFISTASHELKTPLTTIKAFTQILHKIFEENKNSNANAYLYKMEYQVNRLKNLINDLMDVSKMQTGKLEYFDKEFEVDELIKETIEDIQTTTTTHKIIVEGNAKCEFFGDRYRIGQVLNNIVGNAIKYSPNADKIKVKVNCDKKNLKISIQDFGVGISTAETNKIFGKFYRINGSNGEKFEGMGLGLHISSQIIKRHKGKISVESKEGKGSEFSITIPLQKKLLKVKNLLKRHSNNYEKTYLNS